MRVPLRPNASERAVQLAEAALARPASPFHSMPERVLVVDVNRQRLSLVEAGCAVAEYRISTSEVGVGGAADSNRTPPGWHRVHSRIGADAAIGTVFESREPTGERWTGAPNQADLILTRIVRLEGLEPGVNRGPGCDSFERYIYLHGTNHEDRLGMPASHGCIRMANADIAVLFERVREGDPVVIIEEALRERA